MSLNVPGDLQLQGITLKAVLQKRRLDQALNMKEFAVLAGISYSTARSWLRMAGFPGLRRVVFWGDFVEWRRGQLGINRITPAPASSTQSVQASKKVLGLPAKAARILAEFG